MAESSDSRVVMRSCNYAYPNGGVAYAYGGYDSSYTYAFIGSRLAFRGKIEKAASVAAYKAGVEVRSTNHSKSGAIRKAEKQSVGRAW